MFKLNLHIYGENLYFFSNIKCFQPTNDTLLFLRVRHHLISSKIIKLHSFGMTKHNIYHINYLNGGWIL